MQTVSTVLNSIARSQSRAAAAAADSAGAAGATAAIANAAEPRVPTAERVRRAVSYIITAVAFLHILYVCLKIECIIDW